MAAFEINEEMTIEELMGHRAKCVSTIEKAIAEFGRATGFSVVGLNLILDKDGDPSHVTIKIQLS